MVTTSGQSIAAKIHSLKHPAGKLQRVPISSKGRVIANLRPVPADLAGEAADDAARMSKWRNANREHFFTWIRATSEATTQWLMASYAEDDTNLIFITETKDGVPFGQIALYNFDLEHLSCEVGRILRGEALGPPGAFTMIMAGTLRWAHEELGLKSVYLEAFEHNDRGMSLYKRCGFQQTASYPCVRVEEPEMTRWEKLPEDNDGTELVDGYIVRMEKTLP